MSQRLRAMFAFAEGQGLCAQHSTWWLKTIFNSTSRGSDNALLTSMQVEHRHNMWAKHTQK